MTLLFPAFLLGIAALLLPWLLHRFNRETPPETPFPSIRFLESTRVPVSRKKRLRHIGLFTLRTLFLLIICLLFAQPYCSTDRNRLASERNVFVVIDRSASMQTGDRWSQAVAKTAELLDTASGATTPASATGNSVQLFDMASTLTAHGEPANEISAANVALRNLSPSFETSPYGLMMQQLDALASRLEDPVDVWFVTDAQKTNLPLQRRLLRTQHIDSFTVHRIGSDEANLAVRASARQEDGVNVQISAQVLYSRGDDATSTLPAIASATVVVEAGGQVLDSRAVRLSSGVPESLVFTTLVMPSASVDRVSLSINGDNDALSLDSDVTVPIQLDNPVQVGISAIGTRVPESGALFLRTALNTDGLARVITSSNNATGVSDEARHRAVFVPQTPNGGVDVPQAVTDFVAAGGNVLLVLLPDNDETGVPPAEPDFIASLDTAHPLALGELGWQDVRVYAPLEFIVGTNDRVLMRTGSGTALLVERNLSNASVPAASESNAFGRLLILADPLDGVASDLPLSSAFVDWVANTVQWFDASVAFPARLDAGESLVLPAQAQVLSPEGRTLRALSESGRPNRLSLIEPGVHTVVTSTAEHRLAVTVPWAESDLSTITATGSGWGGAENEAGVDSASDAVDSTETRDDETRAADSTSAALTDHRQPLWPYLMPLLALVLLAESLWANRLLSVRRDGV